MQVTVTVSDSIVREAGVRGLPVVDYVESLIDKGLSAAQGRPVLDSAMERIRALREAAESTRQEENSRYLRPVVSAARWTLLLAR